MTQFSGRDNEWREHKRVAIVVIKDLTVLSYDCQKFKIPQTTHSVM